MYVPQADFLDKDSRLSKKKNNNPHGFWKESAASCPGVDHAQPAPPFPGEVPAGAPLPALLPAEEQIPRPPLVLSLSHTDPWANKAALSAWVAIGRG